MPTTVSDDRQHPHKAQGTTHERFLVEMHDWARLPKGFHAEIERRHVVLVRGVPGK